MEAGPKPRPHLLPLMETEYTLQRHRKWKKEKCNLKEVEFILLKNDHWQRNDWPMGIIVKTFPSADGRVGR